jgi:hypothetical protein
MVPAPIAFNDTGKGVDRVSVERSVATLALKVWPEITEKNLEREKKEKKV